MSEKTITRISKKFYEKYQFPGNRPVDNDGLIFLRKFYECISGISQKGKKIHILDAGCGTGNTSISLAQQFKESEFMGIDNSKASLTKAIRSAENKNLTNLKFQKWNLLNPLTNVGRFDVILCLGVLHHTADMKKVLFNLNKVLNAKGELFLWIYGKHGRYNHSLNVRLLKMLLTVNPEPENAIKLVSDFAIYTSGGLPLKELIGKTKTDSIILDAFKDPVWIADQFLNPHEFLIDMEELLNLIKISGFKLTHVFGLDDSISDKLKPAELSSQFLKLNKNKKLIAADLLLKPERYFVLLTK